MPRTEWISCYRDARKVCIGIHAVGQSSFRQCRSHALQWAACTNILYYHAMLVNLELALTCLPPAVCTEKCSQAKVPLVVGV